MTENNSVNETGMANSNFPGTLLMRSTIKMLLLNKLQYLEFSLHTLDVAMPCMPLESFQFFENNLYFKNIHEI